MTKKKRAKSNDQPDYNTLSDIDKGQWSLHYDIRGEAVGVISDDFTHDVLLEVTGDFLSKDQKEVYCVLLKELLNGK